MPSEPRRRLPLTWALGAVALALAVVVVALAVRGPRQSPGEDPGSASAALTLERALAGSVPAYILVHSST